MRKTSQPGKCCNVCPLKQPIAPLNNLCRLYKAIQFYAGTVCFNTWALFTSLQTAYSGGNTAVLPNYIHNFTINIKHKHWRSIKAHRKILKTILQNFITLCWFGSLLEFVKRNRLGREKNHSPVQKLHNLTRQQQHNGETASKKTPTRTVCHWLFTLGQNSPTHRIAI